MKSSSKGKKKTLYGRYDDYDLTDPAEDGFDRLSGEWDGSGDAFPDESDGGSARLKKTNHAMRLVDPEGSGSPSAFSRRRKAVPGAAGRAEDTDKAKETGRAKVKGKATLQDTATLQDKAEETGEPAPAARGGVSARSAGRIRAPRPHTPEKPMVADFEIQRIRTEADGTYLTVTLAGSAADGVRLRRDIPVTVEQYAALSLRQGFLTAEQADALIHAGDLCLAIRKGMELLGYGDMSARRAVYKLTARGVTREIAVEAAAWLSAHGLIREDDAALRRAAQDARKLWGPRRIMQDLRAQGYSAEAAAAALDALTGADTDPDEPLPPNCVDFLVNCASLIRKKYGGVPDNRDERRKMTAALIRMGYDTDMIREAAEEVMREG